MYIRKTHTTANGKTYTNHLLVESVRTPNGPRQRTICSLGSLAGRSADEWLKLAARLQDSLAGQTDLFENPDDPQIQQIVQTVQQRKTASAAQGRDSQSPPAIVQVNSDDVTVEDAREAGPAYVGNTIYDRIGIDTILGEHGIESTTRLLVRTMVLNRLIYPGSEHAMPDWVNRSALPDLLQKDFSTLSHTTLYRTMDRLYEKKEGIEEALRTKECELFGLDDTVFFYDLTSHYFEGNCPRNPQAKRGYSRDSRPDCKQVVVGLVVDKDGFAIKHEVFDGNRRDSTTMQDMLKSLGRRGDVLRGATVVVDRGLSTKDNLASIKACDCHYIVAAHQSERDQWLAQIEDESDMVTVVRTPSPRNPFQKKTLVQVKKISGKDGETVILCKSEGRVEKDRAIRLHFEKKWKSDTEKLSVRIAAGALTDTNKIHEAIGRLKERYPRVARYYELSYDEQKKQLCVSELLERKKKAEALDGSYILKTDREDLGDEEAWRVYMLLTRAESAFRSMKSPLWERPIFHQLERRVQTHIFLCVLAYHLLVAIEKMFLDNGEHTSWETIRQTLTTHQIVTVVLPCSDGKVLRLRRATTPEKSHRSIYDRLKMSYEIIKPRKTFSEQTECSD